MASLIMKQTMLYALTTDISKQALMITVEKILEQIKKLNNHPKTHYTEEIKEFFRRNNIFMKFTTVYEHIKEMKEKCQSRAIESSWVYLEEIMAEMYKELEKLTLTLAEHENKYFSWWREPLYKSHLVRIEKVDKEFENRFNWYEKICSVSR